MISLKIRNINVPMPQKASIKMRIKNNLFNMDVIEATVSLPFTLPFSKELRSALNHIHRMDSYDSINADEKATLYFKGNVFKSGVFRIKRIVNEGYEGIFIADAGAISSSKDSNIREILKDENFEFGYSNVSQLYQNFGKDADVCFPKLFQWSNRNEPDGAVRQVCPVANYPVQTPVRNALNNEFRTIPCFKAKYLFQRICFSLGLKPNIIGSNTLFPKLVFWNNRGLNVKNDGETEPTILVAEHIPSVTLKDFLKGFKINHGFAYHFNSTKNELNVSTIKDILSDTRYEDWTDLVVPSNIAEPYENQARNFVNTEDSNDTLIPSKENLSDFEIIGEVDKVTDLPTLDLGLINKGYVVLEEGRVYAARFVEQTSLFDYADGNLIEWQPINIPQKGIGDESLESPFTTVYKHKEVIFEENGYAIVGFSPQWSSDFLPYIHPNAMYHYTPFNDGETHQSGSSDNIEMFIRFTSHQEIHDIVGQEWIKCYPFDGLVFWVDAPNLAADVLASWDQVEYQIKYEFQEHIPCTNIGVTFEQQNVFSTDYGPKLLIMHDDSIGLPDNYHDTQGRLGEESLYWKGESGLYENNWKLHESFADSARNSKFLANLPFHVIKDINPFLKKRIRGTDFIFKEAELELEHDSISLTQLELFRL